MLEAAAAPAEFEPERLMPDPVSSAREAGLRYVSDAGPGIRRLRAGKAFRYLSPEGRAVRDAATLARIRALAIPPAWTQVWICPRPDGHIQAVGRDARGRKQYRYHPRWREVRDQDKFAKVVEFARALPQLRARCRRDLARPGLPRDKVVATVVRLLEETLIRVGNEEYARQNRSFGLTTLRDGHAQIRGDRLRFRFRGKAGVFHDIDVRDARLARIVKRCQDLPGEELFQYLDGDGEQRTLDSADVNEYLRRTTGQDFTAKDFRTWAGTVLACLALQEIGAFDKATAGRRNVVEAVRRVAERLGNTPAVCRKCYVHPEVLEAYLDGQMVRTLRKRAAHTLAHDLPRLRPEEAAVLAFLERRLRGVARTRRAKRTVH